MKRKQAHAGESRGHDPEHGRLVLKRLSLSQRLAPSPGIVQDDPAPMRIGNPPLLDLLQGSKAAETRIVIIEAAVAYARGSSGAVGVAHCDRARLRLAGEGFDHTHGAESG
jgi:hypothetical protein